MRISFVLMLLAFVLIGWLHLATPLLASLFAYLALVKLHALRCGRWLAILFFLVLVSAAAYALGQFTKQAVQALPEIADKAIPSVIHWAKEYKIELPFTDYDSLRELALETVRGQVHYLGSFAKFARGASTQFLFLIVGIVVAISLFLNPRMDLGGHALRQNLYSACCEQIAERFRHLYRSFQTVMGAQIIISAINTVFTAIFVLATQLPYALVVIGVTFLCGLLPVIGNLISNTIIVGIGFTVSPRMALAALIFLVVIHKLEYLLNCKIVGDRIRNPLWLTLLGLILGERLMGIPGMILAPVVLHYIKLEASVIDISPPPPAQPKTPLPVEEVQDSIV
jgi:predicted PurR-regulated permease PerM